MTRHPMTESHETNQSTPWLWTLPKAAARRLPRAGAARWLEVTEGRVWLTRSGHELQPGDDVWLSAGEHLLLPAGSEWVAEGWPQARVAVLEAPEPTLNAA
jgi:hypothetical protein